MSEKMTCPGCDSHTSDVRSKFMNGEPCPYCGLPAAAAMEVERARSSHGDRALREQLADALLRAVRAEADVRKLGARLDRIKRAVEDEPDEW